MKWIKYQILQNVIDEEEIFIEKKVGYNEANLAIANAEAYNGEYTIEEDDESFEVEPLGIAFGGTGAKDAKTARENLGIQSEVVENTIAFGRGTEDRYYTGSIKYSNSGNIWYVRGALEIGYPNKDGNIGHENNYGTDYVSFTDTKNILKPPPADEFLIKEDEINGDEVSSTWFPVSLIVECIDAMTNESKDSCVFLPCHMKMEGNAGKFDLTFNFKNPIGWQANILRIAFAISYICA